MTELLIATAPGVAGLTGKVTLLLLLALALALPLPGSLVPSWNVPILPARGSEIQPAAVEAPPAATPRAITEMRGSDVSRSAARSPAQPARPVFPPFWGRLALAAALTLITL